MISRLAHRGPDGYGFHLDGPCGLAHSRLAIIDIAGGDQPISNEDGSVWVILNGEIFNYIELRAELEQRGHRFSTHSDTEVIVHLYEETGADFVQQLNGQFAIALWDARHETFLLARDRVGIRPLHYTQAGGRLAFASEIKALFALPEVPRQLDPAGMAECATFWAPVEGHTVFAGVHSLPPGHLLIATARDQKVVRYWDWSFEPSSIRRADDAAELAAELREELIRAVQLQLRADVPVGAYLSGGLDSSIIAAIVRHCSDTPLRTFSLTFEDAEFDEEPFQARMAAQLGTEHTSIRCTRQKIAAEFPRTVLHTEAPIVRTAPTPLMLLAAHVRDAGFKVVLTGEGADEVFGGYDLFKEAKVRRFWSRDPASQLRPRILERLYPYLKNSPVRGGAMAQAFFREGMGSEGEPWYAHLPRWNSAGRIRSFFSSELRGALDDWDALASLAQTLPANMREWPALGRDQYVEAHTLMSGYLLSSQGDRVAMASSIEGRVPFLDHHVIEFANRLPPHLKIRGLREKYLLRKAFADLLPPQIATRTKQPYRAPDSQSFFVDGRPVEYVGELFGEASLRAAGLFDPAAAGRLFEKCRSGRAIGFADNMAFVYILSTMLLHQQFIANPR